MPGPWQHLESQIPTTYSRDPANKPLALLLPCLTLLTPPTPASWNYPSAKPPIAKAASSGEPKLRLCPLKTARNTHHQAPTSFTNSLWPHAPWMHSPRTLHSILRASEASTLSFPTDSGTMVPGTALKGLGDGSWRLS